VDNYQLNAGKSGSQNVTPTKRVMYLIWRTKYTIWTGDCPEPVGDAAPEPIEERTLRDPRVDNYQLNAGEADTNPRVNIQEFCEEYYEDILPIIMEKVRHDRRKDVHTRLDFVDSHREKVREDSHYSNARARATEQEQGRSHACALNASRDDSPKDRKRFRSAKESYGDSFSHSYRDGGHSHHMKSRRDKSPPSSQKKYVKDPVEIHNIKQRDGETIEDFMERFKIKTGRMKGAPECMQIFGFMHGVNNLQLTKRMNEHVPKTMEEMMITTTAFI
nr:reverse transcriptase domain-containing protein [Tanacetum cinerariifolium]